MTAGPHIAAATEQRLFRHAKAGDAAALEALARRWWPQIKRWALLELGDPSLADDAAQETLIRLVNGVQGLGDERPLGGWLRTVVRNCCRDVARREPRFARGIPTPRSGGNLEQDLDFRRGVDQVLLALGQLSPRQREALDLVDRRGFTPTEASAQMGAAPGTVRALLHQARRRLRTLLLDLHDLVRDP